MTMIQIQSTKIHMNPITHTKEEGKNTEGKEVNMTGHKKLRLSSKPHNVYDACSLSGFSIPQLKVMKLLLLLPTVLQDVVCKVDWSKYLLDTAECCSHTVTHFCLNQYIRVERYAVLKNISK